MKVEVVLKATPNLMVITPPTSKEPKDIMKFEYILDKR